MDAGGGINRFVAIGQADAGFEVGRTVARADNHHAFDAGGQGAVDDGLAVGIELGVIEVLEEEKLVENSARMGEIMRGHMEALKAKHRSVGAVRSIGLFGIVEIVKNAKGDRIAPYNGSHPAMGALSKFLLDNGLFTIFRWDNFMCNPPLTIDEKTLKEAFEIIDRGLEITDAVFEG
jgi:taurine--2-oxoglutarate transaminase